MLRPAGYFSAFPCPFDRAEGGGCWRPHCQYLHEASRRPAAGGSPCAVAGPSEGLSVSSITKEDENAKQQLAKPTEVFPREYQEGNSKVSPFKREFTKRSRNYSPMELEESDDECDLVIDVPPPVNKRPRKNRDYKDLNREEELDAVIHAEELHGSAIADGPGYTAEKSEKIVELQESGKCLNESEKARSVSLKANKIYLPDVNTETLKISEQRGRRACTSQKQKSASAEVDVRKEIPKQEKAERNILVKEFVQEYTASENRVGSGRVTQSVLCTSRSSGDEATIERPGKQRILNTEKSRSTDKNGGNGSPQDTYSYPTNFLSVGKEACSGTVLQTKNTDKSSSVEPACRNKKEGEIRLSSSAEEIESSGEDTELSDSDDPIEECRRIFEEFEREARKKDSDKQVHNKNEMEPFKRSPGQRGPNNARVQTAQSKARELTASIATDSGKKKPMSKRSAIQVQSNRSTASSNLREVQPVETISGQLRIPIEGKAQTVKLCRLSVGSFERTAVMPYEDSTQKKPSIPESGSKVPREIRQRYFKCFFEQYRKICNTVNEAGRKARIEEQSIYDRCGSKNMYLNFAVKTLKKLRDHGQFNDIKTPSGAGSVKSNEKKELAGGVLYELLKDYLLTEQQLNENNFPRPNPERNGSAIFHGVTKKAVSDNFRKTCCRCGEIFTVSSGKRRLKECSYHSGRVLEQKVPGGLEKRYSCCEGIVGSAGCQIAKLHVHDGRKEKLYGFVKTLIKSPPSDRNHGIYALNCNMCYTTQGLELTRVTVVDDKLQVVYDTFVKPDSEVVDYNTRFSGVTEDDLKNTTTTLRDVQAILLNMFSADTILIGHSLENDLFALKLIHDTVVDTSLVFPHRLGLPHKRALQSLMADYLMRIHQGDVDGHNSSEDAIACMELILWKVKEDNKRRK
ncbi:exonuclease GOR-like isoform X2 [Anser cygnoides]|uniref:exonuclease GOR-like isoform X2 n=1 Tax=Anser cygnoides TaxID=8845 RepID=UPI002009BC06|nr:exonuclease GOR-like isoform X2 [Anser cygnoides]